MATLPFAVLPLEFYPVFWQSDDRNYGHSGKSAMKMENPVRGEKRRTANTIPEILPDFRRHR
ncbi:MAG: hypothetical protein CL946_07055 [Ectothiorhodospiraceae bacterium]|nr:hypothetical protein [Ectothiorhodospiraceae bacterium]